MRPTAILHFFVAALPTASCVIDGDGGGGSSDDAASTTDAPSDTSTGTSPMTSAEDDSSTADSGPAPDVGGGGGTFDFSCPDDAQAYERIADTMFMGPLGMTAWSRIESVLVNGDRVYFTSADLDGAFIRRVAFDGSQGADFFRSDDYTPVSHLTTGNGATVWWDGLVEPGRVVAYPNDLSAPQVLFEDVLMGPLADTEQYFDGAGNHFILANARPEGEPWRTQLLRRNIVDGSIDVLFSREQPVSGGAATQTYAYLGDTFYIVAEPSQGDGQLGVLPVRDDAPAIDPLSPPAITPASDLYCHDLVAYGSETMWCLGYVDIIEPYSSLWAMHRSGDALTSTEVINVDDQPDEPGRGLFVGQWATDGATVYFTSEDHVDGTGNIVSTIYRAVETAGGSYIVDTVACNVPEVTDMTLTNGELFFATFENDPDELDKHGLFRLR